MIPFQVRPGPLYVAQKPIRDARYKAYVRLFPCVGCGTTRRIEAAHIGPHGISQKASDLDVCPLCEECHRTGKEALHKIGRPAFEISRGISFATLQRMFRRFYRLKNGTPSWWPDMPALTLETCPACHVESFTEELEIAGKCECGAVYRPAEERAA